MSVATNLRPSPAPETAGSRPVVLVTGAAGGIGSALIAALERDYTVVGLDLKGRRARCPLYGVDLSSPDSVNLALRHLRDDHGARIASVIHLAAYFDFTGEDHPLYEKVNVEGTRNLLRALRDFEVEQFVYSGTMLVHKPGEPGVPITEETAIAPKWAYPESKAKAEQVIREEHGDTPYVLLHLAGVYDEARAVPTLSEQIRRIYERSAKSHAYSGSLETGQSFLHREDLVDAFRRAVDRRARLPEDVTILIGEPQALSYGELQQRLAELIHGERQWKTYRLPKPVAGAGAWLQAKAEPVVPDDFDHGEKPFVRPFMVAMADDHYALDIGRARQLLGWEPGHSIRDTLPELVQGLKRDPLGWYRANGLTPPHWLTAADEKQLDAEAVRDRAEREYRTEHARFVWAPFVNAALGAWLITAPATLGYRSQALVSSDAIAGAAIVALSLLTLSWRLGLVRWLVAALGLWLMAAPLLFWAPTAAGYLNGTLVGALVFGFAVATRPAPGIGPVAATTGPTIPPGWDYSPSSWTQRLPIIALALVGLLVSRYLTAYQLGHVDGIWEPFFAGSAADPRNGTEEIITSSVSRAWPVPDAGVGALTYMLEILTGLIGSSRRWRTMPWLVILFGIMIVPLGVVSITFIIIQPIVIGTWCTLCLIAAAAMLVQIPYSVDELVATGQFLARRRRKGRPLLRVFLMGDTDDGDDRDADARDAKARDAKTSDAKASDWQARRTDRTEDEFAQAPGAILRDMLGGGIGLPWTLLASIAIGVWLMCTRLTLGATGALADADHLIGALVVTVSVTALAEAVRPVRFLNAALGLALVIVPMVVDATPLQAGVDIVLGLALVALSVPRGAIRHRYGDWSRYLA